MKEPIVNRGLLHQRKIKLQNNIVRLGLDVDPKEVYKVSMGYYSGNCRLLWSKVPVPKNVTPHILRFLKLDD
jgi:hypothetical protein